MNANDIVNRVSKYDSNLAKEISRYLNSRKYGLVYEESKPEFVRLPNKTVVKGDLVNILPPRGTLENDDAKYKAKWKVTSVDKNSNEAKLISLEKDHKEVTANYDDLVAIARFDQPIYTGLKEVDRIERGGDKPFNTVINGENFHALETLMYAYQGKIDCIYIDPPYNTGAKDWKYNNNYVSGDDSYRHSKWLTFMEDRLKLVKKLLNPDSGVLIVTIDEHEVHRLRMLVEQLFPSAFIQMVTDVINPKGVTQNYLSRVEEYVLYIFMPNAKMSKWHDNMLTDDTSQTKTQVKVQWASLLRRGNNSMRVDRPNSFYPILIDAQNNKIIKAGSTLPLGQHPDLKAKIDGYDVAWPIRTNLSEGRWSVNPDSLNNLISQGYVSLGKYDEKRGTWAIKYLFKKQRAQIENGEIKVTGFNKKENHVELEYDTEKLSQNVKTVWNRRSHDGGTYGSSLLQNILKDKRFTYPKSLYSVYDEIGIITANKPDATILDFFAGSGTTMQAVNLLNYSDNGHRKCILVTNNEVGLKTSKKLVAQDQRPGDTNWEKYGIAKYVTWPRVKSTIQGTDVKGKPLRGNYGCQVDSLVPVKNGSGQSKKGFYRKESKELYSSLSDLNQKDGFKENAIFFDLEYLEPSVIKSDLAFNQIAPLLWLKAGSKGRIIQHTDDYDITNEYAVLFNYKYIGRFTRELKQHPEIKTVFIVTDVNSRYQDLCHELSDKKVYKLYESYLKSFEIQSLN
ncbi:site-specific DNA-methyltransferase [Limosilactobacillus fermentum]